MTAMDDAQDRGDTLIEVLMSLSILSIAVTALLGALSTNIATTGINRSQSQATTTLLAAAEYVKGMAMPGCGAGTTPIPAASVPRATSITSVAFGPVVGVDGLPCSDLRAVHVEVVGDGFDVSTNVVRRP